MKQWEPVRLVLAPRKLEHDTCEGWSPGGKMVVIAVYRKDSLEERPSFLIFFLRFSETLKSYLNDKKD